eukprot:GHVU01129278.1.p2 GENE.GHVU01129278.1~~GHVU01129278.1.p2  ORF type:complete len:110 (-),score=9.00 GHVU01129278.1:705-1034(-)
MKASSAMVTVCLSRSVDTESQRDSLNDARASECCCFWLPTTAAAHENEKATEQLTIDSTASATSAPERKSSSRRKLHNNNSSLARVESSTIHLTNDKGHSLTHAGSNLI